MLASKMLLSEEWSVGKAMSNIPIFIHPYASAANEIHWLWQCVFMKLDF